MNLIIRVLVPFNGHGQGMAMIQVVLAICTLYYTIFSFQIKRVYLIMMYYKLPQFSKLIYKDFQKPVPY